MKSSQFKEYLQRISELVFLKPDGNIVSKHFHVTEIGQIDKRFIDCGGMMRNESVISIQLWESVDIWHRLEPQKLLKIIELSEKKLNVEDVEIEVEYQGATIQKFGLAFENSQFLLTIKNTTCLASNSCGIPVEKVKKNLSELKSQSAVCCSTEASCC